MFIASAKEVLIEQGYAEMIKEDPKRPGPNYYDDCEKFNWVDALVSKHKETLTGDGKNMYDTKFNKEDEAAWQLLQERMGGHYR